jgi:transcriptional regulator with XRE-family HTH domain
MTIDVNDRILGKQFKTMRLALGMSQEELADALGIGHHNSISRYENGQNKIPHLTWVKLENLGRES